MKNKGDEFLLCGVYKKVKITFGVLMVKDGLLGMRVLCMSTFASLIIPIRNPKGFIDFNSFEIIPNILGGMYYHMQD